MASIFHVRWVLLATALFAPLGLRGQEKFPEWRGTLGRYGAWTASPVVAVGDVNNVSSYGEQTVNRLQGPISPDVHKLYWCVGDFRVTAVVKGELRAPAKRYLWASVFPGCELWLWPDNPQAVDRRFKTRVWLLREEGDFLRPTFDSGIHRYIGLFPKWEDRPPLEAHKRLGILLLTLTANSDTLEDYAGYLPLVIDIACELLGRPDCTRRIQALADLGSPRLREVACGFLKDQFGQPCLPW